jgi:hypothetical protein
MSTALTIRIYSEWCDHEVEHIDIPNGEMLRCMLCGHIICRITRPFRTEHFDHG